MLKILQASLQQYMNWELPDVQTGFRKGRGTRDEIANIRWIIKKAREFQKNICFCFIDYTKAFDCVDHNKLWKILQEMGIPDLLTCLLRNLHEVKKQQLELDMEQWTCSKLESKSFHSSSPSLKNQGPPERALRSLTLYYFVCSVELVWNCVIFLKCILQTNSITITKVLNEN